MAGVGSYRSWQVPWVSECKGLCPGDIISQQSSVIFGSYTFCSLPQDVPQHLGKVCGQSLFVQKGLWRWDKNKVPQLFLIHEYKWTSKYHFLVLRPKDNFRVLERKSSGRQPRSQSNKHRWFQTICQHLRIDLKYTLFVINSKLEWEILVLELSIPPYVWNAEEHLRDTEVQLPERRGKHVRRSRKWFCMRIHR